MRSFGNGLPKIIYPGLCLIFCAAEVLGQEGLTPKGTPVGLAVDPDLVISKTHSGTFSLGQQGSYTIQVRNVGTAPSSGPVTVTDQLPEGLSGVSISGLGWQCAQPGGPCQRSDSLAVGLSYPPLTFIVSAGQTIGTLVNTATVAGGGDANTANNVAEDPTEVASITADVRIRKTHLGDFKQGQNGATYSILVENVGKGATAGTVTVTENLPAGLVPVSISGQGWNCAQPAGPCTRSDALAAASSYSIITLTVNVAATAQSPLTNVATVSAPGDTNSNNDTVSDPTTIIASGSDLKIIKNHTGYLFRGLTGTYTLQVANDGSQPSSGQVTVTDTPPQGLAIASMSGFGWTCAQPAGGSAETARAAQRFA